MSEGLQAEREDEALAKLLRAAGSAYDLSSLAQLLEALLSAPEDRDPEAWMTLVALPSALTQDLRTRLSAFRKRVAAARPESGLPARPGESPARLHALRQELRRLKLDGFIIPRSDEHQGESVPPGAERLAWLTGFTGSAGAAVVLAETAAIFVDGRYTLQVRQEVEESLFAVRHLDEGPPSEWIAEHLPAGGRIGFDPWLHSVDGAARLRKAAAKAGGEAVACARNPVDSVWEGQPPPPVSPVVAHDLALAGRSSAEKRNEIAAGLRNQGSDAAVLSLPDSISWLINLRGGDIPRTPVVLSFAILHADGSLDWFLDQRKVPPGLVDALESEIRLRAPADLAGALDALGRAEAKVLLDRATAPDWIASRLEAAGAALLLGEDPCQLPKACKNEAELIGMRAAHRRDGMAMVRFLAWLEAEVPTWAKAGRPLDEIAAAERLQAFRAEGPRFRDLSFDTISGAGANGAIVHYRVQPSTSAPLRGGSLYLVDSGAQYLDGTTDVTRTVSIGAPADPAMKRHYTLVLKGHIALSQARFPKGTTGNQLDVLARLPLWTEGLDYDHGTGHGVGSYLSVHEGPARISKLPNRVILQPGMVLSNEPGYYRAGQYGIRIENLLAVVPSPPRAGEEREMLAFETLTLVPYDRRLIDLSLLSEGERAWVDAYHRRLGKALADLLDAYEDGAAARAWLERATAPLYRPQL